MAALFGKVPGASGESFFPAHRGVARPARQSRRETEKAASHAKAVGPLETLQQCFLHAFVPIPPASFAHYRGMHGSACVVKGAPSYRGGQAWSSPWYKQGGVPVCAQLRERCSRRVTTRFASTGIPSVPA